jgi:hypothetical protein
MKASELSSSSANLFVAAQMAWRELLTVRHRLFRRRDSTLPPPRRQLFGAFGGFGGFGGFVSASSILIGCRADNSPNRLK